MSSAKPPRSCRAIAIAALVVLSLSVLPAGADHAGGCMDGHGGEHVFLLTGAVVTVEVLVGPLAGQSDTIVLDGPTTVHATVANSNVLETEIIEMDLVGASDTFGPIKVSESAVEASTGQVLASGSCFPASSFFDVYAQLDAPVVAHAHDPMHVEAELDGIPPGSGVVYENNVATVVLYAGPSHPGGPVAGEVAVAVISHAKHAPNAGGGYVQVPPEGGGGGGDPPPSDDDPHDGDGAGATIAGPASIVIKGVVGANGLGAISGAGAFAWSTAGCGAAVGCIYDVWVIQISGVEGTGWGITVCSDRNDNGICTNVPADEGDDFGDGYKGEELTGEDKETKCEKYPGTPGCEGWAHVQFCIRADIAVAGGGYDDGWGVVGTWVDEDQVFENDRDNTGTGLGVGLYDVYIEYKRDAVDHDDCAGTHTTHSTVEDPNH